MHLQMKYLPARSRTAFTITLFLWTAFVFAQTKTVMPYKKTGSVYLVHNNGRESVLSVSLSKNRNKFSINLLLHDAQTMHLQVEKEIPVTKSISSENIIGCLKSVLWILSDSLVGYDVHTLEPVATETSIAAKNLFMQNNFSKYPNAYLLDEAAQVLYIGAENGDRYKLYADLNMKPDSTSSDPAPDEFSYEFAAEYKLYGRYQLKFAISNVDTSGGRLYILGSPNETSQVLSYYGVSIYSEREEMRQLTIIPFKRDGEKIDYSKNKPLTGSKKYFKAGFLQNKFHTISWRGIDGERIILFQRNNIFFIALIDKEGKERWEVDTKQPANNFLDYLACEKNLVVWFEGKEDVLLSVELATGLLSVR